MLFNSSSYIIFFLSVFIVNYILRDKQSLRYTFLLVVSYYFYSVWNGTYLLLILLSTVIDYYISIRIENSQKQRERKSLLTVSIVLNLGLLFTFKYYNFFVDSAFIFFEAIGLPFQYSTLQILLPVGISFYTFQSMSYTIDVYSGRLKAEKSFKDFALYIAFFPQLVAGPIIRPTDFLPQLKEKFSLTVEKFFIGTTLIWFGLAKKVIFADLFATYADRYFNNMSEIETVFELLIGVFSFSFQIYFDFSGYTDVAIGSALLLGFSIPLNFNFPYFAQSLSEFWRRWHISLSLWLRDYVYIPLGGNRKYRNLLITFFLSGVWHGASLTFIVWGIYHGMALVVEDILRRVETLKLLSNRFLKQLTVFILVSFGWVIFRVEDISEIGYFFNTMSSFNFIDLNLLKYGDIFIVGLLLTFYLLEIFSDRWRVKDMLLKQSRFIQAVIHSIIFTIVVVMGSFGNPFIYFQF